MTPEAALLVLGRPGCGKSAFFERAALAFNPRLYFGTMVASDPSVYRTIDRHRERRGPGWITLETDGTARDFDRLALALAEVKPAVSLVDGLLNWIISLGGSLENPAEAARLVARRLAVLVNSHPHVRWYLLDVTEETLVSARDSLREAYRILHADLPIEIQNLDVIVFEGGDQP